MQIIFDLSLIFLKIGLFTIGGGYAMLPLIQNDVVSRGWITAEDFANIVAISQMTPGPIGINCATYVGYVVGGIAGSTAATISVVLLPVILSMIISYFYSQFKSSTFVSRLLKGVRPVAVTLIAIASINFIDMSIFNGKLNKLFTDFQFSWQSFALFILTIYLLQKYKIKTVYTLLICAVLGILIY